MLIAALFTIARTWKQPKCSSTEEWIKKVWYTYTMEYYSTIKRKNDAIYSNMRLSYWVKQVRQRKTNMVSLICGISRSQTSGKSKQPMVAGILYFRAKPWGGEKFWDGMRACLEHRPWGQEAWVNTRSRCLWKSDFLFIFPLSGPQDQLTWNLYSLSKHRLSTYCAEGQVLEP